MTTLILSPHMDDEVLGCASFLGAGASNAAQTCVLYFTGTHPNHPEVVDERDRLVKLAGFRAMPTWGSMGPHKTNHLDEVPQAEMIDELERTLDEKRPDTVVIPPRSYNQDHRAVHDAAITALRPHDRIPFVPRVLVYEQPETFGTLPPPNHPTYFRRLDLARKLELYHVYASQVRAHRSDEMLTAIAASRGMVANMPHAEAFEVLRWVE